MSLAQLEAFLYLLFALMFSSSDWLMCGVVKERMRVRWAIFIAIKYNQAVSFWNIIPAALPFTQAALSITEFTNLIISRYYFFLID